MERSGLVKCVRKEEVYRGKKVKFYSCAVRLVKYSFDGGDFSIEVDWFPEEELESRRELGAESRSSAGTS
jgi:predicted transcriptional regulator